MVAWDPWQGQGKDGAAEDARCPAQVSQRRGSRVPEPQAQVRSSARLDLTLLKFLGEPSVRLPRNLEGKPGPSMALRRHSLKAASALPPTPSAGGAKAPSRDGWAHTGNDPGSL